MPEIARSNVLNFKPMPEITYTRLNDLSTTIECVSEFWAMSLHFLPEGSEQVNALLCEPSFKGRARI